MQKANTLFTMMCKRFDGFHTSPGVCIFVFKNRTYSCCVVLALVVDVDCCEACEMSLQTTGCYQVVKSQFYPLVVPHFSFYLIVIIS